LSILPEKENISDSDVVLIIDQKYRDIKNQRVVISEERNRHWGSLLEIIS
jgi:hypothetical protein